MIERRITGFRQDEEGQWVAEYDPLTTQGRLVKEVPLGSGAQTSDTRVARPSS